MNGAQGFGRSVQFSPAQPSPLSSTMNSLCIVLLAVFAAASATSVTSCLDSGSQTVTISGCSSGTCVLTKGTSKDLEVVFTATDAAASLKNQVWAKILGIKIPFVGVHNTDASGQIYESDGTTAATFPLTVGNSYVFKNTLTVLSSYPSLSTTVHWALESDESTYPVCFEVKAKISG